MSSLLLLRGEFLFPVFHIVNYGQLMCACSLVSLPVAEQQTGSTQ